MFTDQEKQVLAEIRENFPQIAQEIFEGGYLLPFDRSAKSDLHALPVERISHGAQHASRVAAYVVILLNFLQEMGHPATLIFTEDDLTLLQLTALFHDIARENDGVDDSEQESAQRLKDFLIDHNISPAIADRFASYILHNLSDLCGKLFQGADSLDIMRVVPVYQLEQLEIYRWCSAHSLLAEKKLIKLIEEIRQLIAFQSDLKHACIVQLDGATILPAIKATRDAKHPKLKQAYEQDPCCFKKVTDDFAHFPLLKKYYRPFQIYKGQEIHKQAAEAMTKNAVANPVLANKKLHAAVLSRQPTLIQELINQGADTNETLDYEYNRIGLSESPIELAAYLGYWDCVEAIAQTNAAEKIDYLSYVLAMAVRAKQSHTVEILLAAGASPTESTRCGGYSALHWAIIYNDEELVRKLMQSPRVDLIPFEKIVAPMELAASLGRWEILKIILRNKKTDQIDFACFSGALLIAAKENKLDIVELLLKANTPQTAFFNQNGNRPAHVAVQERNLKLMKLLLDHNADLSVKNNQGETPIALAAARGNWDILLQMRKMLGQQFFTGSNDLAKLLLTYDIKLEPPIKSSITGRTHQKLFEYFEARYRLSDNITHEQMEATVRVFLDRLALKLDAFPQSLPAADVYWNLVCDTICELFIEEDTLEEGSSVQSESESSESSDESGDVNLGDGQITRNTKTNFNASTNFFAPVKKSERSEVTQQIDNVLKQVGIVLGL